MGRKKIERPSADSLLSTVSRMLVPDDILKDFDIYGAKESAAHWMIELREKDNRIPSDLQESDDVVLCSIPICLCRWRCKSLFLYTRIVTSEKWCTFILALNDSLLTTLDGRL